MSANNRKYEATVILDTRGYEEPVETLIEKLTNILKELGAEIESAESLGRKDFIRVTDRQHTGDSYVRIRFDSVGSVPADLQERVRLDKTIKRVMIQAA